MKVEPTEVERTGNKTFDEIPNKTIIPLRAYTIQEIDRMRRLLPEIMYPVTWYSRSSGVREGSGGNEMDRKIEIEERLRTYMMAGVSSEHLEHEAMRIKEKSEEQRLSLLGFAQKDFKNEIL